MRVDIWSDIVCPWCYLGKRRFEKALAAFEGSDEVRVAHRSFQLDPTRVKGETPSRRAMLQSKYRLSEEQVRTMDLKMEQMAAAEGLEYHLLAIGLALPILIKGSGALSVDNGLVRRLRKDHTDAA